jgi:hypothetical protein
MMDRLTIKDYKKPNYVIMRETPDNGPVIISATFTIKENAIKEVKERIKRYRNKIETGVDEWGREIDVEEYKKWGEPYLVELEVGMKKVEVK